MRESTIENRLLRKVRAAGGECKKMVWPGDDGSPDRLVLMPGGRVWFVETKAPSGHVEPLQKLAHDDLRALGFEVRVLWNNAEVDRFIREEVTVGAV